MDIRLKLMGLLRAKSPSDNRLNISEQATIADVLDALKIPRESVQVFTVNGNLVRDQQHRLTHADELTILPPVGGG